jgi:hypothetical protein
VVVYTYMFRGVITLCAAQLRQLTSVVSPEEHLLFQKLTVLPEISDEQLFQIELSSQEVELLLDALPAPSLETIKYNQVRAALLDFLQTKLLPKK